MRTSRATLLALVALGVCSLGSEALAGSIIIDPSGTGDSLQTNQMLTEQSYDCTEDADGQTPLHIAACEGHNEEVEKLLTGGAQVDAKDAYGRTPLHKAARAGHRETVELLLAKGANCQGEE
jgi:ankyrin repeat protein